MSAVWDEQSGLVRAPRAMRIGDVFVASLSQAEAIDRLRMALSPRPTVGSAFDGDEAIATLDRAMSDGGHVKLAFANSHMINLAAADDDFAALLADFLVLPDGLGVDLGARLLHGSPFAANLNGTDFVPAMLQAIERPLLVGLFGARPGVADRAALEMARAMPRHSFTAYGHGYMPQAAQQATLERLAAERPDIVLVALGNPLQERWIHRHLDARHCSVAAGVGALLDFTARQVVRAPAWMRAARIEWLFRLAQEPGRLWRRYLIGNPAFLARVLRQRWSGE